MCSTYVFPMVGLTTFFCNNIPFLLIHGILIAMPTMFSATMEILSHHFSGYVLLLNDRLIFLFFSLSTLKSASTYCNKFDPTGEYVRRWLLELARLP